MAGDLKQAIQRYQSGAFEAAYQDLCGLLAAEAGPKAQIVMMLAQCCARTERFVESEGFYRQAAALVPDQARMLTDLAEQMRRMPRKRQEEDQQRRLIAGRRLLRSGRFDLEIVRSYRDSLRTSLAIDEMRMMDQVVLDRMRRGDADALAVDTSANHLAWCDDEALNARQTRDLPPVDLPAVHLARGPARPAGGDTRLKVAYLLGSAPPDHPTRRLIDTLVARHDPARFDVWRIVERSEDGARPGTATLSIAGLADDAARAAIAALDFDLLIDAFGHSGHTRPTLLARRLAHRHLALATDPGPRLGQICDGLIADATLLPATSEGFFPQPIIRLAKGLAAVPLQPEGGPVSRESLGLPEDRVIIAALHPVQRIGPRSADAWLQILRHGPDGMLWFCCDSDLAKRNFAHWLGRSGIDSNRIIVSPEPTEMERAAWMRVADLAVDTLPCSGPEATIAALKACVPLAAVRGRHGAGRTSAGLLAAAGLGDLIEPDGRAYVRTMIALATDPKRRNALRDRMRETVPGSAVFDIEGFIGDLEAAYRGALA